MKTKDYIKNVLTDIEKDKLKQFQDDDVMREAVKKIILTGVYSNGILKKGESADPLRNFALGFVSNQGHLDNAIIGQQLRAGWEAINMLEVGFSNIADFKTETKVDKKPENQAR